MINKSKNKHEIIKIIGVTKFGEIINDNDDEFELIDPHYKFIDEDHDLWRFEAIVKRKSDNKYFSVQWEDSYHGIYEHFDEEEIYTLTEVHQKTVNMIIYE